MKTNETGRSMVEMLAVISIIGVLSIGGIKGYSVAMIKHRANVLLNEAHVRAAEASSFFMTKNGVEQATLSFTDNEFYGAEFDTVVDLDISNNRYWINFKAGKEPSEEICQRMKDTLNGGDGMIKMEDDCSAILYNKDMSINRLAHDYDEDQEGCEGAHFYWCSGNNTCVVNDAEGPDCCEGFDEGCCNLDTGDMLLEGLSCDCNEDEDIHGTCNGDGRCICPCTDSHGYQSVWDNEFGYCPNIPL